MLGGAPHAHVAGISVKVLGLLILHSRSPPRCVLLVYGGPLRLLQNVLVGGGCDVHPAIPQ